ncbi:unnamed protein product [Staurois parvus]|uniref:NADH dehydrogenase subunit 4L n=1 Tax=Staurois parvus TaxID=386267 RepID=A0ABN9DDZ4_9NEOB|nr:unnamed protein product [Staurois parvus]
MCHFHVSFTLLVGYILSIGMLYGLHCCCLHRHTVAPHYGFGHVGLPNE